MPTNNVTRFLDSRDIAYQAIQLPSEKRSAEDTARLLGVNPALVYKTIVVERRETGKPILAVVPGNREVDLKALARVVGEKKVTTATQARAEKLTGLQAGGISPLALINRGFDMVIDQDVLAEEAVYLSGGDRRVSLRLSGPDLVGLTEAETGPISST
jgi:Cys-tRNA(Pro)/Cys-tRNA(Cys) deacylase